MLLFHLLAPNTLYAQPRIFQWSCKHCMHDWSYPLCFVFRFQTHDKTKTVGFMLDQTSLDQFSNSINFNPCLWLDQHISALPIWPCCESSFSYYYCGTTLFSMHTLLLAVICLPTSDTLLFIFLQQFVLCI